MKSNKIMSLFSIGVIVAMCFAIFSVSHVFADPIPGDDLFNDDNLLFTTDPIPGDDLF